MRTRNNRTETSGLITLASDQFCVIAFDRPGFGHSQRPRKKVWSPEAQAEIFAAALQQLGVSRAVVLGHSWGTLPAVALALKHPQLVSALVLALGYYYPTPRLDVLLLSGPAVPLVGDVIAYSISPVSSRLIWPLLVRKLFSPEAIPAKFARFPKEMAFRPSQIQAAAAESAIMIPSAYGARARYRELTMPVLIIAGEQDQLVYIDAQSERLHRELPQSVMHRIPGAGHMIHQTETEKVTTAITEASAAAAAATNVSALQRPSRRSGAARH